MQYGHVSRRQATCAANLEFLNACKLCGAHCYARRRTQRACALSHTAKPPRGRCFCATLRARHDTPATCAHSHVPHTCSQCATIKTHAPAPHFAERRAQAATSTNRRSA
eukprot:6177366-Pleurochrysis_carterae.AAC.6